eukprot:GHVP01041648.1.p1 GENE.GHVP01041648.1~~GHVP01041648.1.p1  ORF type:complete len:540 (+),score=102.83 GHVP01041648.1:26-1621(+)
MSAISLLNSKADILRRSAALSMNVSAAQGLEEVLKPNLGPKGTLKMIVGGAGQIKISKDGAVLLHEMQIQHPTASMIARVCTAQDAMTGDGTTTGVILIGEILKQCERHVHEGAHPRVLAEGVEKAREECVKVLESMKVPLQMTHFLPVALTSVQTKLNPTLADDVAKIVVGAVECIQKEGQTIDLHMVEVMHMKHRFTTDTRLVRGIVMDHGPRHPGMPRVLKNCYILTLNVSLEYEKSEINSTFVFSSAEEKEKMVLAERSFTDNKVKKIIELKQKICDEKNKYSFVVLNQKGIDPPALDMLAKEGIMALRRVKRRNMERLTLACGGNAMNSVDDLSKDDLGFAGQVEEQSVGEEKYTFVEGCVNPTSCTILIKGQSDHAIAQVKDAVRDGLRAVKNAMEDKCVIPGAGAFEISCYLALQKFAKTVGGKERLGILAVAESLLAVIKILIVNSGFDAQELILKLITEKESNPGAEIGVDLRNGGVMSPLVEGVLDNFIVKRQLLTLAPSFATQLLVVDEIIKAGKQMGKQ